ALPLGTVGSLSPTFVPARRVCLAVKLASAFTRYGWFPFSLSEPLGASVTLSEATAPVKLPTRHGPAAGSRSAVRAKTEPGWYFTGGSTEASAPASLPPTYPTQAQPRPNVKL